MKAIESCGVSCIAVHGRYMALTFIPSMVLISAMNAIFLSRYQSERSVEPVHIDEIRRIAETSSVPIIAKYATCMYRVSS